MKEVAMESGPRPMPKRFLWLWLSAAAVILILVGPGFLETVRVEGRGDWSGQIQNISGRELAIRLFEGERIVFVDVREPQEFQEFHIPGALSIPLRELSTVDLAGLQEADVVAPYCLKDFRGFEGAKTLSQRGLTNLAILQGFGVKAWKRDQLPVAGEFAGESSEEVLAVLRELLEEETR
jgi:rhodanese-related sulfurtransferase